MTTLLAICSLNIPIITEIPLGAVFLAPRGISVTERSLALIFHVIASSATLLPCNRSFTLYNVSEAECVVYDGVDCLVVCNDDDLTFADFFNGGEDNFCTVGIL